MSHTPFFTAGAAQPPRPAHVDLGDVSVPLSRLVLGTMSFGDTADEAAFTAMFETAIEAGITGIDTANGYARGTTETLIAPLVARYRDRIVLATKAGMPHPDAGRHAPLSAAGLRASVEGSLRRLNVDRIDLFYLHQPDRETPLAETMEAVAKLRVEGKIGALGVSNYAAWQALEVLHQAEQLGMAGPVVGQNVYNLVARRMEDEWFEFADTYGLLTMCFNPLAGGLLVGRPTDEAPTRFAGSVLAGMYRQRYWSPELLAAVHRLADLADDAAVPLIELALRWMLSRPGPGALLLGGDKVEQLEANLKTLAKGPLDAELAQRCSEVTDPLKGAMPAYNR